MKRDKILRNIIRVFFLAFTLTLPLPAKSNGPNKSQGESFSINIKEKYHKANHLYNRGEYTEARKVCKEIIDQLDRDYMRELPEKNTEKIILKVAHFLLANIEAESGNTQEAIEIMERVINLYKDGIFSIETAAEAQLKIGHIYRKVGDYPQAIKSFQKAIDQYGDTSYAKASGDNISEINKRKVGDIYGKVLLEGRKDHGDITISVFNGFPLYSIQTKKDGLYSVPFYDSTEGTYISVVASKDGYIPQVTNIVVEEKKKTYNVPKVTLFPMEDPSMGFLIGVCYQPIRGGKIKPHYGINEYKRNAEIKISNSNGELKFISGEDGSFFIALFPGTYSAWVDKYVGNAMIKINKGKTTIYNLGWGVIKVD